MARTKKKNEIKLEQQELTALTAVKVTYDNILREFGTIAIRRQEALSILDNLEEREKIANKALEDLKKYETQTYQGLESKYGRGSIDVENGIFTPAS